MAELVHFSIFSDWGIGVLYGRLALSVMSVCAALDSPASALRVVHSA